METRTIRITGLIATSGTYNLLQFEIVEDDGSITEIIYPQGRSRGDALAVESSVFMVAGAIYFSTPEPSQRLARATLYMRKQQPEGAVAVDGIAGLQPLDRN